MAYEESAAPDQAADDASDNHADSMPPDPMAGLMAGCAALFGWFVALQSAGFNAGEALYLTGEAVKQAMKNPGASD